MIFTRPETSPDKQDGGTFTAFAVFFIPLHRGNYAKEFLQATMRAKGYIKGTITLILCILPMFAMAEAWTAEKFPMVHLQDARRYVCDPDGVLSPAARDTIDAMLGTLEKTRGVQCVFAIAKRIEGGEPYDFGMKLARKYKIGLKKQNSGLIVVLSTEDRAYHILTGNGLEGTLPDAVCKRIGNRYMVPYLKQGEWDAAMTNTAKAVCAYVEKDRSLLPDSQTADDGDAQTAAFLIVLAVIIVFAVIVSQKHGNATLCPNCKRHTLKSTGQTLRRSADGKTLVIYKCTKCGHTVAKETDGNDTGNHGNGMSALLPFLFMGGGSGNRGTFNGGGSFGGGSFGGGGAGGKF